MKGQQKIKFPHLLASKWTATHETMGWRHFQVMSREDRGNIVFARLQSVCDTGVNVWVNARNLKNRGLWQPGWTPLAQMEKLDLAVPAFSVDEPVVSN
ncbi:MAG: TIGR02450 family Trp-rich protein [Gemmatimonadaceae bacterium]|nr:TIGR02450 family Trp-rich protein [Gloeobacterales cyanobacterium ES-bin-141]